MLEARIRELARLRDEAEREQAAMASRLRVENMRLEAQLVGAMGWCERVVC